MVKNNTIVECIKLHLKTHNITLRAFAKQCSHPYQTFKNIMDGKPLSVRILKVLHDNLDSSIIKDNYQDMLLTFLKLQLEKVDLICQNPFDKGQIR